MGAALKKDSKDDFRRTLAAQAPKIVPGWFVPEGIEHCPRFEGQMFSDENFKTYSTEYLAYRDSVLAPWEERWVRERTSQWPWAWADMVLKAEGL